MASRFSSSIVDHSFAEQIAMFCAADVLAGFSGSAMFGMMWGTGKPTILVSGSSYTANNEFLFGAVLGSELHYFWGPSEIDHPAEQWSWAAFQSNYRFDLDEQAPALREVINR